MNSISSTLYPRSHSRRVIFTSQRHAESLDGHPSIAVISITDEGTADLKDGFGFVSRHEFVDGAYNEDTIRTYAAMAPNGYDHEAIYGSYLNSDGARALTAAIKQIVDRGYQTIVVHCMAGRSRSCAVAKYLSLKYQYRPYNTLDVLTETDHTIKPCDETEFKHANPMVLTLLEDPDHFAGVIRKYSTRSTKEAPRPLLNRIFDNIFRR